MATQRKSPVDPRRAEPAGRILSPAVSRAVTILETLAAGPNTLAGLSRELNAPKSSLQGIVSTLIARKWVETEAGQLTQGRGLFRAAVAYGSDQVLVPTFREVGQRVVAQTGETTFLGMLDGDSVLHLARVDGTQPLRFVAREGDRVPAHASALGKVLLADKNPVALEEFFVGRPLEAATPSTITKRFDLETQLLSIRDQGFALDLGEVAEGLHCAAAPIVDAAGRAIASVALAAPSFRFAKRRSDYVALVRAAASEISTQLGGRHEPWETGSLNAGNGTEGEL